MINLILWPRAPSKYEGNLLLRRASNFFNLLALRASNFSRRVSNTVKPKLQSTFGAFVSCGITRVYNLCSCVHKSCVFLSYRAHQKFWCTCAERQYDHCVIRSYWIFRVCSVFIFTFVPSVRVYKKVSWFLVVKYCTGAMFHPNFISLVQVVPGPIQSGLKHRSSIHPSIPGPIQPW